MSKKRATLFIGSLTGGGAERVTANLANYLNDKDYIVDIITMSDVADNYPVNPNINRIYLLKTNERKNKFKDILLRYKRLKEYITNNQDVDCYIAMLPITSFMISILKKHIKGKLIISERNNPSSYNFINKMLMKYSAKKCDALVVQTKKIGDWYKNNKNKVVIPNAINNVSLERDKKLLNKIVAVGRLDKQKNYPMLINAFNVFVKDHPEYILEIYGSGNQENYLKKMVLDLHIDKNVIFKGYVKNVNEQIKDASIYVMTSDYEGMPNSLIEAMCIGLPCISTRFDGGAAEELIINNENGILIDKNDYMGLVNALTDLCSNPEKSKYVADNAKKLQYVLSYDNIYCRWDNLIIETLL